MARERMSEASWNAKTKRWCCRVMVRGKRRAFYSSIEGRRGKREAERKAEEWLASGTMSPKVKVSTLWHEMLDHISSTKGKDSETYKQREKMGRLYILPCIGQKRLEDMHPIDWQDCIDITFSKSKRKGKPLSAKTLKDVRGALTGFKTYCESREIFITSMRTITIPDDAPVGQRTILQPDDLRALFSAPKPTAQGQDRRVHYLHLWRFYVLTGMRPGEAIALQRNDVSTDGDTVKIQRSVNTDKIITIGKNRNAQRSFILPESAKSVLQDQAEYLRKLGIISPYIFPGKDGSIASERSVYKAWRRFCDVQGTIKCSLYELRHTMVSINADVPDALLKPMVGHSARMDTRGTYGHEVIGQRERTANLVEQSLQIALGSDAKNMPNGFQNS